MKSQEICKRFNEHNFHDSKLLTFKLMRREEEGRKVDDIFFEMEVLTDTRPGHYKRKKAILILKECSILKIDLDLDFKRVCGDDISYASCVNESDLKSQIEHAQLKNEKNPLAGFLHFTIYLIPEGGVINVFARDFELKSCSFVAS